MKQKKLADLNVGDVFAFYSNKNAFYIVFAQYKFSKRTAYYYAEDDVIKKVFNIQNNIVVCVH